MRQVWLVIVGGLVAGLLDIVDAFIFFGMRGVKLLSIPQSISAGLLGDEAFSGGTETFVMGLALHFAIAVIMALVFYAVVKLLPVLGHHALIVGAVYGIGLYLVMTYGVLPLSNFKMGHNPDFPPAVTPGLFNALFAHIVLVGMTIGVFSKRALAATTN